MMIMKEVAVLLGGDIHGGSKYSGCPPKWRNYSANKIQRVIWKKWCEMAKTVKPEYLILNGDLVDGLQKHNSGKEVWTADIDEQMDLACELIKMIDYDKLIITYGSPYHTQMNINADEEIAKRLNANAYGWEQSIKIHGDIFHVSHKISVSSSSWQYRSTPVAKELVAVTLNRKCLHDYKFIIRGHAHYFVYVGFSGNMGIIVPCWQARTPFMVQMGMTGIPKLGYVILDKKEDWILDAETFDMPVPELIDLEN